MKSLEKIAFALASSVYLDDECPTYPRRFPPRKRKWVFEEFYAHICLNPQPLPPFALAIMVSKGLVEIMNRSRDIANFSEESFQKGIYFSASKDIISITGECGTNRILEILLKILKKLDRHFPPLPPPPPDWKEIFFNKSELFLINSVVFAASQNFEGPIKEEVGSFASKNLENIFKELSI